MDEIRIDINGVNVGALGPQVLYTPMASNPAVRFVVREVGVIKGIGNWNTPPIVSVGINAPNYTNMLPNSNLTNLPLLGRNRAQPSLRGVASGQDIYLNVSQAGVVAAGSPVVDFYIKGRWQDITTV